MDKNATPAASNLKAHPARKPYVAPQMTIYGSVQQRTAGGSGAMREFFMASQIRRP